MRTKFREVESLWDWALVWWMGVMAGIFGFCENHVIILLVNLRVLLKFFNFIPPRLCNLLNRMDLLQPQTSLLLSLFHRHNLTHRITKPHFILFHFTNMFPDIFFALTFQQYTLVFDKLLYPVISLLRFLYQRCKCPVHAFVVLEKACLCKELDQEVFVALGELGLVGGMGGFLAGGRCAFVLVDDWRGDVVHFLAYKRGQSCDLGLLGFKYFPQHRLLMFSLLLNPIPLLPFRLGPGPGKCHFLRRIDLTNYIRGYALWEGNR